MLRIRARHGNYEIKISMGDWVTYYYNEYTPRIYKTEYEDDAFPRYSLGHFYYSSIEDRIVIKESAHNIKTIEEAVKFFIEFINLSGHKQRKQMINRWNKEC